MQAQDRSSRIWFCSVLLGVAVEGPCQLLLQLGAHARPPKCLKDKASLTLSELGPAACTHGLAAAAPGFFAPTCCPFCHLVSATIPHSTSIPPNPVGLEIVWDLLFPVPWLCCPHSIEWWPLAFLTALGSWPLSGSCQGRARTWVHVCLGSACLTLPNAPERPEGAETDLLPGRPHSAVSTLLWAPRARHLPGCSVGHW